MRKFFLACFVLILLSGCSFERTANGAKVSVEPAAMLALADVYIEERVRLQSIIDSPDSTDIEKFHNTAKLREWNRAINAIAEAISNLVQNGNLGI